MKRNFNIFIFIIFYNILLCSNMINSKIAIVSLYDENYKEIGKYSDLNKQAYAKLHGYDIYLYNTLLDSSKLAPWNKILAIQNHINDYDYIFWTDADSLIMNFDIKLEEFIDENYDLIISKEEVMNNLNTGHFFIKNSQWSKSLLENLYRLSDQFTTCCWEQDALAYLLEQNKNLYKKIKILNQRAMNSHVFIPNFLPNQFGKNGGEYYFGDFIIHFYGGIDKQAFMKEYYYLYLQNNN